MSQSQLPDEFVTICSCVQEEIKTNNSHAFRNLSSFACILCYDFFLSEGRKNCVLPMFICNCIY